ncbi:MAG: efflux RND transporter periplasmic adaptor subunit [Magnetospirillum sp.]|nr:efflux RND transporter periplasmic adaptor subunit [Magnetospirillum sp.]
MKRSIPIILAAGIATAIGGFWLGRHSAPPPPAKPMAHAQHGTQPMQAPMPAGTEKPKGKILYYRNPMNPEDVSPVPKKDSMGMDYVPVYEGEAEGGKTLKISLDKVQKLGVRSEPAEMRALVWPLRAVGTVQVDERKLYSVTPRFEGYIQVLHVDQTGQKVTRGQPLMEIWSPDLVLTEQEYVAARRGAQALEGASPEARNAARSLAEGALARLRNWEIDGGHIARLTQTGQPARTLTLASPATGIVLEKRAVQGMRFTPGEELYRIADLSTVWVIAEVFEQDLARVKVGDPAIVTFDALPGTTFAGAVTFIYPTLNADTRTGKVRIELPNPDGRLRPALYGTVEIKAPLAARPVLTVRESAILHTGTQPVVLVELGQGLFEPREIKTGAQAGGYVEVLEGLKVDEKVVVSANFLIDSESNLRAALQSFHQH